MTLKVRMRPVGRPPKTEYSVAELVKLYQRGYSTIAISKIVGISQGTVWRHLKAVEKEGKHNG